MKAIFRIVALLEGLSYVLLLFVAVPLKYWAGEDFLVKLLGMPHGLLFVLYIAMAYFLRERYQWNIWQLALVFASSIIPFATFYVDRKYLR
ncbi:MAG: DUF3817 domain-containing protein [Flavobacteriales bacterium]